MTPLFRRRAPILGAVLLTTALCAAALADPPPAPPATGSASAIASASASAIASASASASGSAASAAPPPPFLVGADVPAERSKKPTEAEWREGKKVRAHRGSRDRCELLLVREWLRVLCKDLVGVGLVAGDPQDVTLWTGGTREWSEIQQGTRTMVQFPLVRGTSRILGFLALDFDYDSVSLGEGGTMSVLWREGDADPIIGIHEPREPGFIDK